MFYRGHCDWDYFRSEGNWWKKGVGCYYKVERFIGVVVYRPGKLRSHQPKQHLQRRSG